MFPFSTMDHFTHCCYAVKAIPKVNCEAPVDGFSSCDDLMKNRTLQIFIWILGILAFGGNLIVVAWRCFVREDNRVHSFLLTNLAVSDFLMGLYLLIIAIKDTQWQGEYFKHDFSWRTGELCKFAGAVSMVSSEVSVAMLTIITADRLVCIVFPFRFKRLSLKRVYIICTIVWLLGIAVSVVPLMEIGYFIDKKTGFGFYGRSAVCLPLQLSSDRPAGWEYSVSFFIGFNFMAFMFMLSAYIAMFVTAKRIGGAVRSTSVRRETAMAAKMMFIILTDFFCWMPVIIIGVLSLTGNLYDPKQLVYVWIAVFVLPVNSSINPLLYTFSTTTTRKKLKTLRGTMSTFMSKNMSVGKCIFFLHRTLLTVILSQLQCSWSATIFLLLVKDDRGLQMRTGQRRQQPIRASLVRALHVRIPHCDVFASTGRVTALIYGNSCRNHRL